MYQKNKAHPRMEMIYKNTVHARGCTVAQLLSRIRLQSSILHRPRPHVPNIHSFVPFWDRRPRPATAINCIASYFVISLHFFIIGFITCTLRARNSLCDLHHKRAQPETKTMTPKNSIQPRCFVPLLTNALTQKTFFQDKSIVKLITMYNLTISGYSARS